MSWLIKAGVAFLAALFDKWLGRLKRDREMRQEGRDEVIQEAHNAADDRKARARDIQDDWHDLDPDERERLRIERGHYRADD